MYPEITAQYIAHDLVKLVLSADDSSHPPTEIVNLVTGSFSYINYTMLSSFRGQKKKERKKMKKLLI